MYTKSFINHLRLEINQANSLSIRAAIDRALNAG
jgi:hypothetical protein